ncbi:MAG: DNA alkylation repair protein [Clostridia bacterium]|nr:DNA alkylation repair protein [Clostridia bacterium]
MFDFKIESKEDLKTLLEVLNGVSKNETIEDHKRHIKILNTKQNVIAISMSNIRKFAKQIFKAGYEKFLELSLPNNFHDEFYEETLIQGLVIAEIKDLEKQKEYFKKWIHKIDNWSTCDTVVSTMKGLKNSKEKNKHFEFYYGLCFDKREFVSRFGIIVLMTCFLEDAFIDKILEMCETVKSDAYYVNMALAWLLSFAFMKFKEKTYELLNKKTLSKFVQNKAICKCRDSFRVEKQDKKNLIKFRIK